MSRHRNVRNYAYEEDMYEDVYGHSVEEHDLCVSPTTARQFLYRRGETEHPNLSSFMEEPQGYEEEVYEDERECLGAQKDYKPPKLDRESQAKLLSCMDQFRSILGDHCDEEEATAAILKHDFDLEKAIDDVLSEGGNQDLKSHNVSRREKDVLKIQNISKLHSERSSGGVQPNKVLADSQGSSFNKPLQTSNETKKFSSSGAFLPPGGVDQGCGTQCLSTLPSRKNPDVLLSEGRMNDEEPDDNQHTRDQPLPFMNTGFKGSSPLAHLLETRRSEGRKTVLSQFPISATGQSRGCSETVNESSDNQLLEGGKSAAFKNAEASFIGKDAPNGSTCNLPKSEDRNKLPLSQLLKTRPDDRSKNAEISHVLNRKPESESSSVSPLRGHPVSKEKQSDGNVTLSTPGLPQNKGSISSQLSDTKQSPRNETKFKSLSELIEETQSCRSQDSQLPSLMSTLNIQDSSKSPLSLLGAKQASENKTQVSTKTSPSYGRSNVEKFNLSPPSQLSKEKRQLVNKGSGTLLFNKLATGEAESSQGISSIVHIPKNDGSSPLSQLLKTRQSPKDVDYGRKECLDNNSNVNIDKDGSSDRAVFHPGKSTLFKQFPRDRQNTNVLGISPGTSWASDVTKDIDLSTLLTHRKPHEKTKKLAEHTDLLPIDGSSRISSNDVEDGFRIQPIEVDENLHSRDSVLELLHVPSTFACTLLVYYKKPGQEWKPTVKGLFQNDLGIVPFNFSTPSPDDNVTSKQKKAHLKNK